MSTKERLLQIIFRMLIIITSVLILLFVLIFLPVTYEDWVVSFRPSALNWQAPYQGLTYNPPWLFFILHPFALLPPRIGAGAVMFVSFLIISLYVRSPLKVLFVSVSAPMIVLLTLANIDSFSLLGLMFPYWVSLPVLMVKPQGVFLASLKRISIKSIGFTVLIIVISIFVWGYWWIDITSLNTPVKAEYNLSAFPYSMIPGVILLVQGYRKKSDALLCAASLCFSPYFMITSLLPAVAASLKETKNKIVWTGVVLGSWTYNFLMK